MVWPALLFGAIGAGVAISARVAKQRLKRSQLWPSVRGSVTKSYVRSSQSNRQSGYAPELEYTYWVDRQYVGRTINLVFERHQSRAEAEEYCAGHPVGSELQVFYNPSDPSDACLERGDSMLWMFELVGLIFVGAGALMWLGIVPPP